MASSRLSLSKARSATREADNRIITPVPSSGRGGASPSPSAASPMGSSCHTTSREAVKSTTRSAKKMWLGQHGEGAWAGHARGWGRRAGWAAGERAARLCCFLWLRAARASARSGSFCECVAWVSLILRGRLSLNFQWRYPGRWKID
jgi:hypothetical protein